MTFETDPFDRWDLTPVINVSGTMTSIGASRVHSEVIEVVSKILDRFVSMDELQSRASGVIAKATGAEAGCVTGCSASAVTQGVAAAITGCDLAAIEDLPDPGAHENRVVIQRAHMINYGAPVDQAIALAGAQVVPLGTSAQCEIWHLHKALEQGCGDQPIEARHHDELHIGRFECIGDSGIKRFPALEPAMIDQLRGDIVTRGQLEHARIRSVADENRGSGVDSSRINGVRNGCEVAARA